MAQTDSVCMQVVYRGRNDRSHACLRKAQAGRCYRRTGPRDIAVGGGYLQTLPGRANAGPGGAGNAGQARERAAEHVSNTVSRSTSVEVQSVSKGDGKRAGRNFDWLYGAAAPVRTRAARRPRKTLAGR